MKTFIFYFSIVALVAMVLILATLPLRIKKLTKKMGTCLLPLSRKKSMLLPYMRRQRHSALERNQRVAGGFLR